MNAVQRFRRFEVDLVSSKIFSISLYTGTPLQCPRSRIFGKGLGNLGLCSHSGSDLCYLINDRNDDHDIT